MKEKSQLQGAAQSVSSKKTGLMADLVTNPLAQAAIAVCRLRVAPTDFLEAVGELTGEIVKHNQQIKKGDLSNIEELLYSQALMLDATFHKLLSMAAAGTEQEALMSQRFEMITGLAAMSLKAQEQSRKTLVALAELKNPKRSTTFIKNYVDKQLNHLSVDESPTHPQLQEDTRAEMDFGSERKATAADPEVETVGEINGSEYGGRKSSKRQKQYQARAQER